MSGVLCLRAALDLCWGTWGAGPLVLSWSDPSELGMRVYTALLEGFGVRGAAPRQAKGVTR